MSIRPARTSALPFELVHQIISYYHASPPNLAQFCLVTHTFLFIAQPLLFRSIKLHLICDVFDERGALCDSEQGLRVGMRFKLRGNVRALRSALVNNPLLGAFVEEIKWEMSSSAHTSLANQLLSMYWTPLKAEEVVAFREVLDSCPALSRLEIDQGGIEASALYVELLHCSTLDQISSLVLNPMREYEYETSQVRELPVLLLRMARLKVLDLTLPWGWVTKWDGRFPTFQLHSFTFRRQRNDDSERMDFILGALRNSTTSLLSLSIPLDVEHPTIAGTSFVNLTNLPIQLRLDPQIPTDEISRSLSSCPNLLHLTLSHHFHDSHFSLRGRSFTCTHEDSLFSSLPPTLTHLSLWEGTFPATTFHRLSLPTLLSNLLQIDHLGFKDIFFEPTDVPLDWTDQEREQYIAICELRGIRWDRRWREVCPDCEWQ